MHAALWYVIPVVVAVFGLVVFLLGARMIGRSGSSDSAGTEGRTDADDLG